MNEFAIVLACVAIAVLLIYAAYMIVGKSADKVLEDDEQHPHYPEVPKKLPEWYVSYYRGSKKYFPMHNKSFIYRNPLSGMYEDSGTMPHSCYSKTLEGAREHINKYKTQIGGDGKGIQIIEY